MTSIWTPEAVVRALRQLYAMRLLIEGLICELEAQAPPDEDETDPPAVGCPHPEPKQVDASVMGGPPMVLCLTCGQQRLGTAPREGVMRPPTVHMLAQLLRHFRGCVTTIEKWVAQTPPNVLHEECAEVIYLVRGVLGDVNTTLSTAPVPDRASAGDSTTVDSARPVAARSRT